MNSPILNYIIYQKIHVFFQFMQFNFYYSYAIKKCYQYVFIHIDSISNSKLLLFYKLKRLYILVDDIFKKLLFSTLQLQFTVFLSNFV